IGFGELRVIGIGHRRVEQLAVIPLALAQGAHERLIAPDANAGFEIGRDIGPDHDAKRSLDRTAAGEGLARAGDGVTARAVASDSAIPPPLDLAEILRIETCPDFVLRAARRHEARRDDQRSNRGAYEPACEQL